MQTTPHIAQINRHRLLGCEFEFTIPLVGAGDRSHVQKMLANVLSDNGLPAVARQRSSEPLPFADDLAIEYDSSIEGEKDLKGINWMPIEMKTRPLTYSEFEQVVPKALSICSYLGARSNRSTGFHLHLDLPEFRERPAVVPSLYNLVYRFEPVIYCLVPHWRQGCGFCNSLSEKAGPLPHVKSERALLAYKAITSDRYSGLNLTNLLTPQQVNRPHVELRYAAGTLDADYARHWVRFWLQVVEHAVTHTCHAGVRVESDRKGLDKLFTVSGFKTNSKIYHQVAQELRETGRFLTRQFWRFKDPTSTHPCS